MIPPRNFRQVNRSIPLVSSAILAAAFSAGCGSDATDPTPPTAPPNVIVVVVDTLRADRTSLHGAQRPTTPFLERLALESVVFDRAWSQSACTYPSVNSLLTSRYPFRFYSPDDQFMGIPDEVPSMAELFAGAGYRTGAISASPIVRATPSDHNPGGGFGRGFETFDESCLWREAPCVNARALEVLANLEEPFLLYLHYMDPHGPYAPPEGHRRTFVGDFDGPDFIAAGNVKPIAKMLYGDGPPVEVTDADLAHLRDLYDEEIRYFDARFEEFLTELSAGGVLDRSVLVVTSDHGEEFMEHGHVGHCRGVWTTLTWVPMLFRGPGIQGGRRIASAMEQVHVLPTLLDLAGIEYDSTALRGRSWHDALTGFESSPTNLAFMDQTYYRAVDDGRFHLIFDAQGPGFQLFDPAEDPLELRDLFAADHPDALRLQEVLGRWMRETGQWGLLDQALASAAKKEEMLRALGYLE